MAIADEADLYECSLITAQLTAASADRLQTPTVAAVRLHVNEHALANVLVNVFHLWKLPARVNNRPTVLLRKCG